MNKARILEGWDRMTFWKELRVLRVQLFKLGLFTTGRLGEAWTVGREWSMHRENFRRRSEQANYSTPTKTTGALSFSPNSALSREDSTRTLS